MLTLRKGGLLSLEGSPQTLPIEDQLSLCFSISIARPHVPSLFWNGDCLVHLHFNLVLLFFLCNTHF